ncbi:MAG: DoxX family protein [Flammeovirgaceae bacterium]|nr:MAG: DoxX family protein [Flammeovirgaceae bacterium]
MIRKIFSATPLYPDAGLLLLRFFSAFLMYYGYDKLINFSEKAAYWPDPLHVGGGVSLGLTIFAELVCPVFIILGLQMRLALVPAILNMCFAILIGHAGQPFLAREHAFSFLVPFVVLFFTGPGKYSLDAGIHK